MAADQSIIDLGFDVPKVESQKKAILAALNEVYQEAQKFSDLKLSFGNTASGLADFKKNSKELEVLLKNLDNVQAKYNKSLIDSERVTQARLKTEREQIKTTRAKTAEDERATKAAEKQKKETERLNSEYYKLELRQRAAIASAREMGARYGALSPEFKKAADSASHLTKELNSINRPLGDFRSNVGNYSSAFDGINNSLLSYGKGLITITALHTAFNKVIDTATIFQGLEASIHAVVDTEAQYADTMEFLNVIAAKYGQNIITLTGTYKGLAAAAKGTSLEGAGTKRIFEAVITAGTALKLSNDQVEGSLLAIQQMMSKGKVQAEELRGQLGERLPGAFGLFAKAAGVSTSELDKMLKNGEVLASDILPKFAIELEKAYGTKAIENAEGLINAQNRLSNSFNKFLVQFANTTHIDTFWAKFKGGISNALDNITNFMQSPSVARFFDAIKPGMGLFANFLPDLTKGEKEEEKKLAEQRQKFSIQSTAERQAFLDKQLKQIQEHQLLVKQARENGSRDTANQIQGQTNKEINLFNSLYKLHRKLRDEEAENEKRHDKEMESLDDKKKKKKEKKIKEEIDLVGKLEESIRRNLRAQEEFEMAEAPERGPLDTSKAYEDELERSMRFNAKKQAEEEIAALDAYKLGKRNREEYQEDLLDIQQKYAQKNLGVVIEELEAELKFSNVTGEKRLEVEKKLAEAKAALGKEIIKQEDEDLQRRVQKLTTYLQTVQSMINNVTSAIGELNSIAYDRDKARLEEIAALQEKNYAREIENINNSTLSEEDKANRLIVLEAERQAQKEANDRKNRKLDADKARFDRLANIGNIITSTALAVVNTLKDPKLIALGLAIPLAVTVGALGAAQLARAIATPVAKYAKGVLNKQEDGIGLVGEAGKEVVHIPGSDPFIVDKPTLLHLPKHSSVFNEDMIRNMQLNAFYGSLKGGNPSKEGKADKLMEDMVWELRKLNGRKQTTTLRGNINVQVPFKDTQYIQKYIFGRG